MQSSQGSKNNQPLNSLLALQEEVEFAQQYLEDSHRQLLPSTQQYCFTFKESAKDLQTQKVSVALPVQKCKHLVKGFGTRKEREATAQVQLDSRQSETQRRRFTIELQAKSQLFDESERKVKYQTFFPRSPLVLHHDNQKIQGFYQEEPIPRPEAPSKGSKFNGTSFSKYSNISNLQGQLQYWSKKRSCLPLKSWQTRGRPQSLSALDGGGETCEQGPKVPAYKINNLKTFTNQSDDIEAINRRFIAIQDKYHQKKSIIKKLQKSNESKSKQQSESRLARAQQFISSIDIRQIITSTGSTLPKGTHYQGEYPFNEPSSQDDLKTKYEHFKPSTRHFRTYKSRYLSTEKFLTRHYSSSGCSAQAAFKCGVVRKELGQKGIVHQKIGSIFRRLKDLKSKEMKVNTKHASLHNIHSSNERDQGVIKFYWNKQRNRLRNSSIKSETVDIGRLSLEAGEQQRQAMLSLLKGNKLSVNSKSRTEPSERTCQIISPVFISQLPCN